MLGGTRLKLHVQAFIPQTATMVSLRCEDHLDFVRLVEFAYKISSACISIKGCISSSLSFCLLFLCCASEIKMWLRLDVGLRHHSEELSTFWDQGQAQVLDSLVRLRFWNGGALLPLSAPFGMSPILYVCASESAVMYLYEEPESPILGSSNLGRIPGRTSDESPGVSGVKVGVWTVGQGGEGREMGGGMDDTGDRSE
ncbi:hypothetical protein Tco_1223270 [Tanacetum coccineum]